MPDVSAITAYENGELDDGETIALFASLVASGLVWSLQGNYGRTAAALIKNGYISRDGAVLVDLGEGSGEAL